MSKQTESKNISTEEIGKKLSDGQGVLRQVVKRSDGTEKEIAVMGGYDWDGIDRTLNIYMNIADLPLLLENMNYEEIREKELEDPCKYENGYMMTVDYIDEAETQIFTFHTQEKKIVFETYIRDLARSYQTIAEDHSGEISTEELDSQMVGETKPFLTFLLALYRVRAYLLAEGIVQELYDMFDETAGVLINITKGGKITTKIVKGKNRPDLVCSLGIMGDTTGRPYVDELFNVKYTPKKRKPKSPEVIAKIEEDKEVAKKEREIKEAAEEKARITLENRKIHKLKDEVVAEQGNFSDLSSLSKSQYMEMPFDCTIFDEWRILFGEYVARCDVLREKTEYYFSYKQDIYVKRKKYDSELFDKEKKVFLEEELNIREQVIEQLYIVFFKQVELEGNLRIWIKDYDDIFNMIMSLKNIHLECCGSNNAEISSQKYIKYNQIIEILEEEQRKIKNEEEKKIEIYDEELVRIQNEIRLIENEVQRYKEQCNLLEKATEKKKESISNKAKEYDKQLYPLKQSLEDLKQEINCEEMSLHNLALEAQKAVFGEKKKMETVREKNQQLQIMKDKYDKMYANYSRINELKGLVIREQVSIEEAAKLQKNMFVQCTEQCKLYLDKLKNIEMLLIWCKENHCC